MSPSRTREERAHSIRTVLIASAASAIAAIVTSFFWRSGTPIAAAVTPVIVALVSELLYHPTAKITERVTSEGLARSSTRRARDSATQPKASDARLEQLGRTGTSEPPEPKAEPLPPPSADAAEPTRYHADGGRKRGKIHPRFVIVTALIAFVVAAAIITLPELLGGESIGSRDNKTTFFGGGNGSSDGDGKDTGADKDESDPAEPKGDTDQDPPSTGGGSGSDDPADQPPKKPPAAAPAPGQQSTQETQTDSGSTSTTPR